MSKRSVGRKVKRSKNLYKKPKSGFRKALEIVLSVIVVVGLGFVGFTVADALIGLQCDDCERHRLLCICETPVLIPVDSLPETPSDVLSEPPTDVHAPTDTPAQDEFDLSGAVYAPANVLSNSTALLAFIAEAKSEGYSAVVIEMKDEVGQLLYLSGVMLGEPPKLIAEDRAIVTGSLSAQSVASAIAAEGLIPVARVNTLRDHIAPLRHADVTYAGWLDGRPDSGGRAWANPFLQGTRVYNTEIVRELHDAGFEAVILAGVTFPTKPFSALDRQILHADVTNLETRYRGLVEFVNAVAAANPEAVILLEASENDEILQGKDDFAENVAVKKQDNE